MRSQFKKKGLFYGLGCGRSVEKDKKLSKIQRPKILCVLQTDTALLNISFSLSGSSPKYRCFVSVVKEESDINFAALL